MTTTRSRSSTNEYGTDHSRSLRKFKQLRDFSFQRLAMSVRTVVRDEEADNHDTKLQLNERVRD
jgi:hypothetical protein